MPINNELMLYQTADGTTRLQVLLENETVWLTQAQMSELFQTERSVISRHIRNVFREGEIDEGSNVQKMHIAPSTKPVSIYNLDVIISVGYRVNSHRGVQFRIWATKALREYIVKGFVMDDERLSEGHTNYFDELIERVRHIRTSEANFYEKVRDIFATSIDYASGTEAAHQFFSTVQNKFHFAITGYTAAELITSRVDSNKPNMGLTNWKGGIVTRRQAQIAKNYLEELELKRLELLVDQFLSFAELRSIEQTPMYMTNWTSKLDEFLVLNEKDILTTSGSISHEDMEVKVRDELAKYNQNKGSSDHEIAEEHGEYALSSKSPDL